MDLNKKFSPDLIFLQETKNSDEVVIKQLEALNLDSHFLVSPLSPASGGLALYWKSDVQVQVLSANPHFIDTLITYKK